MEDQLPKNVDVKFKGGEADPEAYWQWKGGGTGSNSHGKILGQIAAEEGDCVGMDDDERIGCEMEGWNGCRAIMGAEGEAMSEVDVNGIGMVPIPTEIIDPAAPLQEMKCRQNPGARTMASAEFWEQKVVVIGGKSEMNSGFKRDVWARHDRIPSINFKDTPPRLPDGYSETAKFSFEHDTAGGLVEYKIWDYDEKREVIPWTVMEKSKGLDVAYLLDRQPFDYLGPGSGWYLFYLRAIDPAGNVGYQYDASNVYLWYYETPPPWPLIIGCAIAGVGFMIFCYMEYRRRKKKAAMERYAIKRMRRKFKGQAKGEEGKKGQDWRALSAEGAGADGKEKKKKKKKKEKSKKKKGLAERTKDKKKDKKKSKDKDKKKSKDKDKKSKDKDKKKKKEKDYDSKAKDKDKKKKSSKEGDKEKKKHTKDGDKERKKEK
jgi:hypothetical protein